MAQLRSQRVELMWIQIYISTFWEDFLLISIVTHSKTAFLTRSSQSVFDVLNKKKLLEHNPDPDLLRACCGENLKIFWACFFTCVTRTSLENCDDSMVTLVSFTGTSPAGRE